VNTVKINYFSDVLCIWAYISNVRIEELHHSYPEEIEFSNSFFHVFGFALEKLENNWQDKGGLAAYDKHISEVAEKFEHIEVKPNVWSLTQPKSSMPAHLYLSAIKHLERLGQLEKQSLSKAMWQFRLSFFREGMDISSFSILESIANNMHLPITEIRSTIDSGIAHAELAKDLFQAQSLNVNVSPTLIFNEGRQKLAGNVGYRVIEANIKELLNHPKNQKSWC
jgi:predicted DsbA family dithiol-disulfide isomerase